MFAIRLFCNTGMSTSLLVGKVMEAAELRGLSVDVAACPASEIERVAGGADCVLLGPQVGCRLVEAREVCDVLGIPVGVIPAIDYGMVNGARVLDLALGLISES